jgi:hypothetical protein
MAWALLLAMPAAATQPGFADPEFSKVPFREWLSQGRHTQIRWEIDVTPPELSTHQRLIVRVAIRVDGRDLEKRRGGGDLVAMVQFEDAEKRVWQNHTSFPLAHIKSGIRTQDMTVLQYAFVLPGDYTLSIALCDTTTLEHNVMVRRIHVAPLKNDPLPDAWSGLPNVEFVSERADAPDVWYLPEVGTRLRLARATRRPVHIQILLNTTPTGKSSGSLGAMRRDMSVLIPALKALTQLEIPNACIDTALLDLVHRRVSFEQKDVHGLDWPAMRKLFVDTKPGIIDVQTLRGQWKMRNFFRDEVTKRLRSDENALNVVIVLSGPAFLEDQEPLEKVEMPTEPNRRLFYIRYRAVNTRPQRPRVRPGMRPQPIRPAAYPMPVDDLEHAVEPLHARLFDATSAEQFRRILAAVLDQIADN